MKKMDFPYQKENSVLFGIIYRPIIDFEVKTKFGWIPVLTYADSGADISLLPRSFLYFLDVKFREDEVKEVGGVGGGKVPVIVRKVELRICDGVIRAKVAIALIKDIPYLRGREDVFDHFEVCFRNKKKITSFKVEE
jgi:hypothetical protein